MRWWGWGEDAHAISLPDAAAAMLRSELSLDGSVRGERVTLERVKLPAPALDAGVRSRLVAIVGEGSLKDDHQTRVSHAAGKSYPDLVRVRSGNPASAPSAVVAPASAEQVAAVLGVCASAGVAVVPFGGGTSVVGGVEALTGAHATAVSLDLSRMDRVIALDHRSLTATLEPGIFGPDLERRLAGEGLTLGHFPQSFEFSTVGGWVATRSAGQASTGYGRIDDLVDAVEMITPTGPMATRDVPATAAGPSLRELIVGSEGVLGVITSATLRVRRLPECRHYEAWSFKTFAEGAEAFRAMEQADASPDVARLSDEEETRLSKALGSSGSLGEKAGTRYLGLRGHGEACLAFTGFEGAPDDVARRRGRAAELLRAAGGLSLGQRPGRLWLRGRFAAPYLRDDLLDRGVMVETLETASTWTGLPGLYAAVREALVTALSDRGTQPLVGCHLSHLYRSGASLYFTYIARQEQGAELEQWWAAKQAAGNAILANGGTITHHHAVGRDHTPWMQAEVGALGLDVLRAVKERMDPSGIMNPGKLLPEAG